jgi:hypothetical protein
MWREGQPLSQRDIFNLFALESLDPDDRLISRRVFNVMP